MALGLPIDLVPVGLHLGRFGGVSFFSSNWAKSASHPGSGKSCLRPLGRVEGESDRLNKMARPVIPNYCGKTVGILGHGAWVTSLDCKIYSDGTVCILQSSVDDKLSIRL